MIDPRANPAEVAREIAVEAGLPVDHEALDGMAAYCAATVKLTVKGRDWDRLMRLIDPRRVVHWRGRKFVLHS